MAQKPMYRAIPFSKSTTLTRDINSADDIIHVADAGVFPPAPNRAVIGGDEEGETILYAAKAEGLLSGCTRGISGMVQGWNAGEMIFAPFTAEHYNDLVDNMEDLAATKPDKPTAPPGNLLAAGEGGSLLDSAVAADKVLQAIPEPVAGNLLSMDAQGKAVDSGFAPEDIGAVKSVFGRTGEVVAQAGDYTAAMVGAADRGEGGAALNALSLEGHGAGDFARMEVGTWPAKFKGMTTPGNAEQTITQANYCKIGPLVTVTFDAVVTNWGGATGGAAIDGLPYVASDLSATPTRGFIGTTSPWTPAYIGSQRAYSRFLILKASNLTTYDVSEIKTPTRIIFTASYLTDLEG